MIGVGQAGSVPRLEVCAGAAREGLQRTQTGGEMTVASQARPSLEVMEIGDALETILLVLAADKAAETQTVAREIEVEKRAQE